MPPGGGLFGLLRHADYRRLWLADGLWWQSLWMEQLILGWVALELTDSAWWVAVVAFCRSVPLPVVGLFGPVWGERFRRRRLILALQGVNLAGGGALLVLHWIGALAYWHLTAVALTNGAAWAMDWPTRRALIPDLVGRERVVDGMVLESSLQSLTRLTGPLIAGLAMARTGVGGGLAVLVGLSGAGVLILAGLRTDSRSPAPPAGLRAAWRRLREGLHYVHRQPGILGTVLITVIMNAGAFPFQALLPVIARDVLGRGPFGLGLLGAANGAGALAGMVVVHWARRRRSNELIFAAGSGLACLGLLALSVTSTFGVALAALVVSGIGQAGFSIMQSAIILVRATDDMRARIMGTLVLAIGAGPFGRVQGGAMAALWGAPVAVGSMAVVAAMATLAVTLGLRGFVRVSPAPAPGTPDRDPAAGAHRPSGRR